MAEQYRQDEPLGAAAALAQNPAMARARRDRREREEAVAAVTKYREDDPQGWARYLAEAEEMAGADAPISDAWTS